MILDRDTDWATNQDTDWDTVHKSGQNTTPDFFYRFLKVNNSKPKATGEIETI